MKKMFSYPKYKDVKYYGMWVEHGIDMGALYAELYVQMVANGVASGIEEWWDVNMKAYWDKATKMAKTFDGKSGKKSMELLQKVTWESYLHHITSLRHFNVYTLQDMYQRMMDEFENGNGHGIC